MTSMLPATHLPFPFLFQLCTCQLTLLKLEMVLLKGGWICAFEWFSTNLSPVAERQVLSPNWPVSGDRHWKLKWKLCEQNKRAGWQVGEPLLKAAWSSCHCVEHTQRNIYYIIIYDIYIYSLHLYVQINNILYSELIPFPFWTNVRF